jgi:hypothetical protein
MPLPAPLQAALADRYRLERELGRGGMATVYLAHDLRNRRAVAIKVLRPEFAAVLGAERFLKEIETTANLQHPHILPLFDSGIVAEDGRGASPYYVMPFVEGDSLRDRLRREKQLSIAETVRIASEVAAALDYAHRRGILHRDIKPENILLQDGRALVADFGIALAMRNAGGARLTETGLSLGTPPYMSPEQASAERELDGRSDVYSLGAVTYEMLTGEPPFTGPSAQAIVTKLMTEAPRAPATLRKSVPAGVEAAVMTALEKLPADRWTGAAEFAAALGRAGPQAGSPHGPRWWLRRAVAGAVVVAVTLLGMEAFRRATTSGRIGGPGAVTTRAVIPLGADVLLVKDGSPFDISADGSEVVYTGEVGGVSRLYRRRADRFEALAIPGTEGGNLPFFSPDGRWIGFFADGKLKKVDRDGGGPITLADASASRPSGGTWGADGRIVYALSGPALHRVSAEGGEPEVIPIAPASDDSTGPVTALRWPSLLPGGRHLLVTTNRGIAVVTQATGALRHVLRARETKARYLATGHLAFDEGEGRIRIAPFDLDGLRITGGPVPAFEAFRGPGGFSAAQFAVSETGTLVYVAGGFERSLVLVDRNGRETPIALPARGYRFPQFSPDGKLLTVTIDPRPSAIWVVDLTRGSATRVTTESHSIRSVWSADGARLGYFHARGLYWSRWPGGETPEPVLASRSDTSASFFPNSWAPDGRIIANHVTGDDHNLVTFALGDTIPRPLVATPAIEDNGVVSPDGRWLAYDANTTGAAEVYIRPYPGGGGAAVVSTKGGVEPHWSRDGRELYYRAGTRIMAVSIRSGASFETTGPPRELFGGSFDFFQDGNWDVGPDGRFVLVRGDPVSRGQLMMVVNWFEEVRRAVR